MKWSIPSKTFLLGEYAALADLGAIILTTTPCFEIILTDNPGLIGIHEDSPAAKWWRHAGAPNKGLTWVDPFNQCGGLGASSAQFLGAYYATASLNALPLTPSALLDAYWSCAWSGQGVRPSGYDVLAQSYSGCVIIERQKQRLRSLEWPFPELTFILAHTGNKLATHQHLLTAAIPECVETLGEYVKMAQLAFENADAQCFVDAVNQTHRTLRQSHLVHEHSLKWIDELSTDPRVLAIKGCGALGADVLLIITTPRFYSSLQQDLTHLQLCCLPVSLFRKIDA